MNWCCMDGWLYGWWINPATMFKATIKVMTKMTMMMIMMLIMMSCQCRRWHYHYNDDDNDDDDADTTPRLFSKPPGWVQIMSNNAANENRTMSVIWIIPWWAYKYEHTNKTFATAQSQLTHTQPHRRFLNATCTRFKQAQKQSQLTHTATSACPECHLYEI